MSRLSEACIAAFQTLTRLPVPSAPQAPDDRTIALSALFYPWVGLLLGVAGWVVLRALTPHVGAPAAALAVLVVWALATGALHEDGLADVADAFGSQLDREGLLRVMKDSRIGAYGALALVLATLARWTLLADLALAGDGLLALLASQSLGRAGVVALAAWAGPATQGMGSMLARSVGAVQVVGAWVPPAALLLWLGPPAVVPGCMAASLAVAAAAALYFRSRLGGVTGDCLGAAFILQEIAVLASVRAALG